MIASKRRRPSGAKTPLYSGVLRSVRRRVVPELSSRTYCQMCVPPDSCRAKASRLPSGDQLGRCLSRPSRVRRAGEGSEEEEATTKAQRTQRKTQRVFLCGNLGVLRALVVDFSAVSTSKQLLDRAPQRVEADPRQVG